MFKFDEQIIVVPREIILIMKRILSMGFNKNKPEGQKYFDALSQYEVKRRGDMEEGSII